MRGEQLARRLSVSELVRVYQESEARLRAGLLMVRDASQAMRDAYTLDSVHSFDVKADGHRTLYLEDRELDGYALAWRRTAWLAMIERLELRRMMSIAAWEKLDKQIREGECPPIDEPTVHAMLAQFAGSIESMLADAVKEVFDWLRPCRTRYKTNSQLEIGERVCISGLLRDHLGLFGPSVDYYREQHVTALEKVFSALDGRGSISKSYYSELSLAIQACKGQEWPIVGETRYFAFRGYKNRSLHIRFKRLDLLARFNAIAGGKNLRPPEAATP